MKKFKNLTGVMEADTISKNGRNPKSLTSRRNIMKTVIILAFLSMFTLPSFGQTEQTDYPISSYKGCGIKIMENDLYKEKRRIGEVNIPAGWRLPTVAELECMCKEKKQIGNLHIDGRWPGYFSSETDSWGCKYIINFDNCRKIYYTAIAYVRLVKDEEYEDEPEELVVAPSDIQHATSTYEGCNLEIMANDLYEGTESIEDIDIPEGWRLPTVEELECMCRNRRFIKNFTSNYYPVYFTNEANDRGNVYVINFENCKKKKSDVAHVRLVRDRNYKNPVITPPEDGLDSQEVVNTTPKPVQTQVEQPRQPVSTPSSDLKTEFYRIGDDDKAMLAFFKRNNFPKYYNLFDKACKRKKSGNALLGVGLGTTGVGIILVGIGANQAAKADDLDKAVNNSFLVYFGGSLTSAGGLMTLGGIINCSVGASRKKHIKNDFEREYFGVTGYTYQPKLNFGTTATGIGLTLNF